MKSLIASGALCLVFMLVIALIDVRLFGKRDTILTYIAATLLIIGSISTLAGVVIGLYLWGFVS